MKNNTISFFALLLFISFFTSCANYYYSPNDGDLVMLRKKHDAHISAATNLGGDEDKRVTNIQAGYSPIKHFAFAGSYFKTSEGNKNERNGNGYILNGSIGGYYFFPTPSDKISKRKRRRIRDQKYPHLKMEKGILLDLYAGTSEGKVNNFYQEGGRSQFKFRKDYVQFGFHVINKNWGFSYNARRGWLNYSDGQVYNRLKIKESELQKFQDLTANNSFDLIEHSFRIYAGIKHCRYFLTISGVVETPELNSLGIEDTNMSIGLIFEIDEFFRDKKNKEEVEVDF